MLLILCNQNNKRSCFPWSLSTGNLGTTGITVKKVYTVKDKEAADGGGKDGEEESDRNQGNTKVNRWHSPDGPGLEKLQKSAFILHQLPTKPACVFTQQAVLFHSDFSQSWDQRFWIKLGALGRGKVGKLPVSALFFYFNRVQEKGHCNNQDSSSGDGECQQWGQLL